MATVLFEVYADPTADIFPTTVPTAGARTLVPARDVATALETGGDTREGAMQAVQDWLRDTTAACPSVVNKRLWAVHPRVAGFTPPATDCDLPFKSVTLG